MRPRPLHSKYVISTMMSVTCAAVLLSTGCGDKKTSPVDPVPTNTASPAPADKAEAAKLAQTQREEDLYNKAEALLESLHFPIEVVLEKPVFSEHEQVRHFVGSSCKAHLAKMSQAPKNPTNLFDEKTMITLCDKLGPNLIFVPGKYFLNEFTEKIGFDYIRTRTEITLRPDFTVSGYQMTSEGGRKFNDFSTSAVTTPNNLLIVTTSNDSHQSLKVKDLSGRFVYEHVQNQESRFGGNPNIKALVYPNFEAGRTLEIKETHLSESSGIFSSGHPASTRCTIQLLDANGEHSESTNLNRPCF